MRYFLLTVDDENPQDIICFAEDRYFEKYDIKKYDVSAGKWIKNWNGNFKFFYESRNGNRATDYLGNNLGWLIFSDRFKDLLMELNVSNLQFLPIKIVEKFTGQTLHNYSVANITSLVDALDLNRSVYKELVVGDIKLLSVIKFSLKAEALNNVQIFRLQGYNEAVFISENIKKLIEMNNLTGFYFIEVKVS